MKEEIAVASWHNLDHEVFAFVAYKGDKGVRLTVMFEISDAQSKWLQEALFTEFPDPSDRLYVAESFNNAYKEYIGFLHKPMGTDPATLAMALPAVQQHVTHPETGKNQDLMHIIMNLNDHYKWTREAIADWLETLDVDIRFKEAESAEPFELTP